VQHNKPDEAGKIELTYLSNGGERFEIFLNPSFSFIMHDLKQEIAPYETTRKITVYTEDNEARWLLKKLLEYLALSDRVDILEHLTVGCDEIRSLCKADPVYFNDILCVLDGDAFKADLQECQNIVFLPEKSKSPELTLLDYLCDDTQTVTDFFDQQGVRTNVLTRDICSDDRQRMKKTDGKLDRIEAKAWFNEVSPYFNRYGLFDYWAKSNTDAVQAFKEEFIEAFNRIAKSLRISFIKAD
jgi:hypothetical protein